MAQSNALQKHTSTQAVNDAKTPKCQTPCCEAKDKDDKLAKAALITSEKVILNPQSSKKCKKAANEMNTQIPRFDSYREALPSARAASEMNELGDASKLTDKQKKKCITMLPLEAKKLNTALGLPQGTITDTMLRNDKTGFRAALFKDEATGKLILVARDTQKNSLVDWQTNIYNGMGKDPDQYKAMRDLTEVLDGKKVPFDLAGYSKGAGLAQEAGLIAENAQVRIFNAAGLHENSLLRTNTDSFDSLIARTKSFSAEGEFLTFMNETIDPQQQIANGRFLRNELAGNTFEYDPMKISYSNPAMKALKDKAKWYQANPDKGFKEKKAAFIKEMDDMVDSYQKRLDNEEAFQMFPPVRSGHHETITGSGNWTPGLSSDGPNLMRMKQHLMPSVLKPMEKSVNNDRKALQDFILQCGS